MIPVAFRGARVAVLIDGELTIHADAPAAGGYDTLCGVDANDEAVGHQPAGLPAKRQITCEACWQIWRMARRFEAADFVDDLTSAYRNNRP